MRILSAAVLFLSTAALAQTPPPTTVDWRVHGAVTAVKNAGQCNASWAFAAVAVIEGVAAIHSGHLQNLSEQELVSCAGVEGNHGCDGGNAEAALEWIVRHGITTQANYPYTAREGMCRLGAPPAVHISGVRRIKTDTASLTEAVAQGPVAVTVDSSSPAFERYDGRILKACGGLNQTHWVTIVGYGEDQSGLQYWIIKNSSGTGWGEHGFMRMAKTPQCRFMEAVTAVP